MTAGRGLGLRLLFDDVREFHVAFGHPAPTAPTAQSMDRAHNRAEWVVSECRELQAAGEDIVGQADAYIDIIYFAVGGLVELGLQPHVLWDIVQQANMAKLWPDGKPHLSPEGRVQKPPGWVAPEPLLAAEVARQQGG